MSNDLKIVEKAAKSAGLILELTPTLTYQQILSLKNAANRSSVASYTLQLTAECQVDLNDLQNQLLQDIAIRDKDAVKKLLCLFYTKISHEKLKSESL